MSSVRKIQLTGGSTYIVSLPSKWVKKNNLVRSSEIKIDEEKDKLILYGNMDVSQKELARVSGVSQSYIAI